MSWIHRSAAKVGALRVTSQNVSGYGLQAHPIRALPEIARELSVDGIVEGSIVRSGGRVRITAQLIHASCGPARLGGNL